MNLHGLQVIWLAVGSLLVFMTGYSLTLYGRPYGAILLAVHKLGALGVPVYLGILVYRASKVSALNVVDWCIVSLTFSAFAGMIVTGGVLSAFESPPTAVSIFHKLAAYATVALTVAMLAYVL